MSAPISITPARVSRPPDFWRVFGHSYCQFNFVTRSQAGRMDSAVRAMFDIEFNNWANHAVNGAKLMGEKGVSGGYPRVFQQLTAAPTNNLLAPYVAHGGCTLLVYGINDLGWAGNDAQYRTQFGKSLDLVISRCRASIYRNQGTTATAGQGTIAYGAGWTALGFAHDFSTGPQVRQCTSTTTATITITLPTDYKGGAVTLGFGCNAGALGGTITFSGTAGVTGPLSVSNLLPTGSVTRTMIPKRITNLTSANAGQTIICTTTQVDASGVIYFDGFWIESLTPPPVLVCNINKMTQAGYNVYTPLNSTNMSPISVAHAAVDAWNTEIKNVVATYDSMVQIVDMDAAIDADNLGAHPTTQTLGFDGLHPVEFGASRIAVEVDKAVTRLRPTSILGASQNNPQSKRSAAFTAVLRDSTWYTSNGMSATGAAYTPVANDMWAIPFFISGGQWQVTQWSIDRVAAGTVSPTVYMAIYDDREMKGEPRYIHAGPANTNGSPLSIPLATGAFTSSTTSGQNGYVLQPLDAGLYWAAIKVVAAGTGQTWRTLAGQSHFMPNLSTTGAGNVSYSGWKFAAGAGALDEKWMGGQLGSPAATTLAPMIGLKMQYLGEFGT